MTTIDPMSTVGTTAVIMPSDLNDGWTYVASAGHYKTPDLLAALNAVPESKLFEAGEAYAKQAEELRVAEGERDEARNWAESELAKLRVVDSDGQDLFDRAVSRADRLEAERDALAKTVERVRALAEKWRYKGEFGWGPWQAGEGPDPEGQVLDDAASELCATLDPEPAFVLPTEAGAGVMATDSGPRCYEREYRLFTDGMWHGVDGSVLHPKTLMANYIAHRLIEDVA